MDVATFLLTMLASGLGTGIALVALGRVWR